MDISSATLKRNAGLIYGVIIGLGLLLSSFVYTSSNQVEEQTLALVDQEIPIFEQLQNLETMFIEQELYLNEYYANQNRRLYQVEFLNTSKQVTESLDNLAQQKVASSAINELRQAHDKITELAVEFDQNMEFGDNNALEKWDLAREHLESFAMYRNEISPILNKIAFNTNQRIQTQYQQTKGALEQTTQIVFLYSLLILSIAIIIGRYIKSYILVSVKNKRLALFPQRNPNPIMSFDQKNIVSFSNPATKKLLKELGVELDEFCQTLTAQLEPHQQIIKSESLAHRRFEVSLGNKTLDCELHWLSDLETWDIHLVDITQRKKAEDKLQYQAFHQIETGLYNKNKFVQVLSHLTEQNEHVAIGTMEMRHYSQLVSRLGLEQTAMVVKELAELLSGLFERALKDHNYSFYQTSDKQFSLIIDTDFCTDQITQLVKNVESAVERQTFCNGLHIELDFGFCCYPEHADDKSSVIKCLNMALDQAISTEHSSLIIYDNFLGNRLKKELTLTEQLRHAIERQDLTLYFQPQLDIEQQHIVGVETLIRWQLDGEFVSPAEFIPLAEKSGLIIPLGQWIALNACEQAKKLIEMGYEDIVVAINISPQQFKHPSFFEMITGVLAQSAVPPENIELEITEGVILYNEADTIELLNRLKSIGLKLSIDDFGTGYSSLSYLKQFPIDKLKIDQSFIHFIENNNEDKAIVKAIVDLGKNLGLTLIAEGVENQQQLSLLGDLHCHEIQGFHFSRPLPEDKLHAFLITNQSLNKSA